MTEDLIETACAIWDLPRQTLLGPSRAQHVVEARQALMLALRRRTHMSLQEIARAVGRADHTTVGYGIQQAERRCRQDADYRACVAALLDSPDPAPIRPPADVRLRWSLAVTGGIVHARAA